MIKIAQQSVHWKAFQQILKLGWPIALALLLQAGFNIADMKFVSLCGKTEMAAVGLVTTLFFLIFTLVQIFGIGTVSLVSRACGRREYDQAQYILKFALSMLFIVSALLFLISFFMSRETVWLLGARGGLLSEYAASYLRIVAIGLVPNMLGWVISYGFQGSGDFKTPMYSMLLATILNLALDPILILGWGPIPALGIEGAAIATVIAQTAGFVFVVIRLLLPGTVIHIDITTLGHWDMSIAKRILKIGMPAGIQTFILFLSLIFLMNQVAALGDSRIAAVTIVVRFLMLIGIPALALADVVTSLVGRAFGARNYIRSVVVAHTAFLVGLAGTLILGIIGLVFDREIIAFFAAFENSQDSKEVLQYGLISLRYIVGIVLLWLPVLIYGGAFKGAGDTVPPMIAGFGRLFLILLLPLIPFLDRPFSNIMVATLIAFGLEGIAIYLWYTRRLWIGILHLRKRAPEDPEY